MKRTSTDTELIKHKLREKYGKKIKTMQSIPVAQNDIPEGPFVCSVCSEVFQRKDITDFIEHIATHEAVDIVWSLRSEELAGTHDNLAPEIVDLAADEWEMYMEGREGHFLKEFKEIVELENDVKIRQKGDISSPLPLPAPAVGHHKVRARMQKPQSSSMPSQPHYTPNRPYFASPHFTVKPVRPLTSSSQSNESASVTPVIAKSRGPKVVCIGPSTSKISTTVTSTIVSRPAIQFNRPQPRPGMKYQMVPCLKTGGFIRACVPSRMPIRSITPTWSTNPSKQIITKPPEKKLHSVEIKTVKASSSKEK